INWINAASFTTSYFRDIYITRTVEEKYSNNCLVPKFDGFSTAIAYGAISGIGKGPLILMNKEWGKVSVLIYRKGVATYLSSS
ncbi:hypothetical protein K469DRAFT_577178, partial [Zopfia rhizophila CBS 207.26]